MFTVQVTVRKKTYDVDVEFRDNYMKVHFMYNATNFNTREEVSKNFYNVCKEGTPEFYAILESILKREIYIYNKRRQIKKLTKKYYPNASLGFMPEE